jgi:hypothetical protein
MTEYRFVADWDYADRVGGEADGFVIEACCPEEAFLKAFSEYLWFDGPKKEITIRLTETKELP